MHRVTDLLGERAAGDQGAPALVVDGGDTLTFGEWEGRSNALAHGLVDRGVHPGDRVALVFDNDRWTDYAVSYAGVLKAGAVAVPLGPRLSRPEIAELLRHCDPAGVVSPADLVPAGVGTAWVVPPVELERGRDRVRFAVAVDDQDVAEILYTSGTTGRPKGVACTHANVAFHDPPPEAPAPAPAGTGTGTGAPSGLVNQVSYPDHIEQTRAPRQTFVHAFPVGTNAGQEVLRFPLRRDGRTAVVLPVFDPDRLCALVAEHGIRKLQLVPAMAQLILTSGSAGRHDVSSVEQITLSSAPTPPAVFEALASAFPKATLWNTYALTEAGTARTLLVVDGGRGEHSHTGSVGQGVGGTLVRVVREDGSDARVGEPGEVWLSRPGAPMRSYYRDPEATAATFAGEWVRTGDVGYLDADGYLYLTDRKKDMIITGGSNVASVEVETVLHEHPAVADAAVFGVPHPVLGQDVAAAVVLRSPVGLRQLQSFVRDRLAEHKTPHRIVVVDELPRNPSGKLLKRALRERYATVERAAGSAVAAGTEDERLLVSIWEEVLGREHIEVGDDFFELGGHSLAAARVATRIRDALGVDVPIDAVFDSPTVAELAKVVEEARAAAPPA